MKRKKLKNAPLKEAVFELLWEIETNEVGAPVDPGFDVAQGRFVQAVKKGFPVHKRLIPEGIPITIYPRPVHQLWQGELTWPVIQFGPGILSVNDTDENYVWEENYRPLIHQAIHWLTDSYDRSLDFKKAALEYIDVVELSDEENKDISGFISKNFKLAVQNKFQPNGSPRDLHLIQTFDFEDSSILTITLKNGINNSTGRPALIWTTGVKKTGSMSTEDILKWLDYGHNITSETFFDMLNPDFYEQFH